ncbi:SSI family serine proteinase inhibitor [Streptomyces sp. NPDC028635]|uniref:SSI family serine proteinase inhibitor n=1 Tax=Streptomyces sp. NPDC028635 TaxID=3154800 RepID=UPI0033FF8604
MSHVTQSVPRVLRRLLVLTAVTVAAGSLSAAPSLAYGRTGSDSLMPPPVRDEDRPASGDHLVVTVQGAGQGRDGTYEVFCHPDGGTHPDAAGACQALDRNTRWGQETFAPVPEGTMCTMQYGGPATAHVTGTWAGRPVDARFDRGDGCEIGRWDRFVPLLPDLRD